MARAKGLTVAKDEGDTTAGGEDAEPRPAPARKRRPTRSWSTRPPPSSARRSARRWERGVLEIGDYVFKKFFKGDAQLVRSRSASKGASFRALLERCDTLELPLRRSTLQNAVSVAAMQHVLGSSAASYKLLPHSHQVALLPVRDPKRIEKLATRAISKKLTVRLLREEVAEERAAAIEGQEKRGRKPDPVLLKALKGATGAFTVEGRLRAVTKGQAEELSDEQKAAALKMAQQLLAHLEGVVAKLG